MTHPRPVARSPRVAAGRAFARQRGPAALRALAASRLPAALLATLLAACGIGAAHAADARPDPVEPSTARTLPRWEVGAGVTALALPDYRGSDETRAYAFPIPWFVYRGERLRADRQGVRGMLFDSDRLDLDLSLAATVPVSSSRNEARRGMPNLAPVVEIGPSIEWVPWRSPSRDRRLVLSLPVRAAFALESGGPRSIGAVFSPQLSFDWQDPPGLPGWWLGTGVTALVGSREYHRYYYEVAPGFATASRPAYAAPGGYSGARLGAALGRRFGAWWVGGFVRWDTVAGAAFADSPLVRQRDNLSAGLAIAWVFAESSERVRVDD